MNLRALVQYFEIVGTHAWASIRSEARQTYAGYLWWLIDPLMFIAVYYVVFALVLGSKTEDFVVFLLVGILTFQWFQSSIQESAPTIYSAGALLKRIRVNKTIFPVSKVFHGLWRFLFTFVVYSLIVLLFFEQSFNLAALAAPIVALVQLTIIAGLSLILASLYPFFPDVKHLIQPFLRALLFLSGVFFAADKVPEELRFYFFLNPMAGLIEAYRDCLLRGVWPDAIYLSSTFLAGTVLILLGLFLVRKFDSEYAKVIP
jgi:lipopolysaccharide transport system permease protein